MSADNGIYILETPGKRKGSKEYRVAHLQAIDNLEWDLVKGEPSADPDVHIDNARDMWGRAQVFTDKAKALLKASELADEILEDGFPLEYGISTIRINRRF